MLPDSVQSRMIDIGPLSTLTRHEVAAKEAMNKG